ncbi:uncharacterized protein V6R79_020272 [Siganus canaliculatus]
MSAADWTQGSEGQFLCSLCLDVFTDPVTTPCGHNFCKNCINEYWNVNYKCQCPVCKELFGKRPHLKVNTFILEMAAQFRRSTRQRPSSVTGHQAAKPGQVPCDICTGPRMKAIKSCLVCLVSYCDTHLEPHLTVAGLKRHQLIEPVENLEGRMCWTHDKPLELFCRTDQMCICPHCPVFDHKTHNIVPLKEEYDRKKAELVKTEAEIQQMIQERQQKIQEMKQSVKLTTQKAHAEVAEGIRLFTVLKQCVERGLIEFTTGVQTKQRATQKKAEGIIKELEQEISELKKRSSEMLHLSLSEDHVHLLQSFPSLNAPPPTQDWTEVSVPPESFNGALFRALTQLTETLSKELKKLLTEAKFRVIQQYAVDVTLDADTAHPELILSNDGKRVNHGDVTNNFRDSSQRFSHYNFVLGAEGFSSGRFYFEVGVRGKTKWNLGVVRESVDRKTEVTMRPEDGYWTIWLRNGNEYRALAGPSVSLSLQSQPQKLGVFVDYDEGLVSFYDVNAAALIYSFTGCSFTEKLYPFFSPCRNDGGSNSAPLIICPVNQTA